ncbi:hypothetical protein [Nitrosomonas sp. wSCUT-2]
MSIPKKPFTLYAVSVFIALSTILAERFFWHIGYSNFFLLLSVLALLHVIVSIVMIKENPDKFLLRLGAVVIFITGQWWLIELIAMLIIWNVRGFAP